MKSLTTLIRLKKREIDALKREQSALEQKREDCITALNHLADQLRAELKAAETMPDMAQFFGNFAATIRGHQQQIDGLRLRLEREIDVVTAKIREQFSEMKKYEIALENDQKRRKNKAQKAENQAMDEIAITQYSRRHES
jgi:flagellar FliJ protein